MELIPACRKYKRLESKMNDATKHLTWSLQKVNVMKNKRGGRGLGLVKGTRDTENKVNRNLLERKKVHRGS